MRILVDADACPVKHIVVKVAKEFGLAVTMFIDTSHELSDGYSEVVTVEQSRDSVDIALINRTARGDIVVTQDFGLAALALGRDAQALNQNGLVFSGVNMDKLLFERHLGQKVRRAGGRTTGPKKRSAADDARFEKVFRDLLRQALAGGAEGESDG
jgi:uncharacterized protein YaiI (UPF0178 family)